MQFVSSTWPFTALTGLLAVVVVLVAVSVVIGVGVRGRNEHSRRAGPVGYFLFGLSLLFLGVMVVSAGVAVHAASELVGPAPGAANIGDFPTPADLGLPPCSAASSPSSTGPNTTSTVPSGTPTTIPAPSNAPNIPCIDYGSSGSSSPIYPSSSGLTYSSSGALSASAGQVSIPGNVLDLYSGDSTNHYISEAVAASLFAIAAVIGYALVWPRACLLVGRSDLDDGLEQFALGYAYLIAGLSAISLLVFVPLTADSVFRAIAPGVNQMSGHAEGTRDLVTFLVLSMFAGAVLLYHLRLARNLRDPAIVDVDGTDEIDETTDDDTRPGPEIAP